MNLAQVLVPAPVIVPMAGAAGTLILSRRPRLALLTASSTLIATLAASVGLLFLVDTRGEQRVFLGGWGKTAHSPGPLGVELSGDRLSALMLVVSACVLFAVLVYAVSQGVRDGDGNEPVSIFLPTYLALTAGVCDAFLAHDIFNLYVGFEVLLASSYVLLTIGGGGARIRAGISYVMVSILSSTVFLIGIALIYATTGSLNFDQVGASLQNAPSGLRSALFAVLLVAFGVKSAIFPLSAWLPDSYPTAPAPVTAVFAGLLTKVGVYAIIRAHTLLFPGAGLDAVLLVAALGTMVIGILGALAQSDMKRVLSFTLVSHIGYLVFGVALSTPQGLAGTVYYVAHHILVQTTLFLVVGLIERQAGASSLRRLGGLGAASPLLAALFLIPALNLAGIPPFSGFIGKLVLTQAAVAHGGALAWILIAGGMVTSLLTLYTIMRVWNLAFWRRREDAPEGELSNAAPPTMSSELVDIAYADRADVGRMPYGMVGSTIALVVLGLGLAFAAGPILGIAERAAVETRGAP
ncbi:NADH/Ubiquinone/plastoquinone (complex I) [Segniliparus rotundus DSM 44985]|uniref:NADH/Ubiquinone/plastoquinone (Complex I) n=1 Tax=Segniliparus rotundus (strain ATCC BAA-972 / CDC 1076 / CIP 108378 / DSM 44985 / JCM 13578) TaxID=640132 RepID=D6ZB97_SEGRD|nr:Na+/H+ antiporter subunit D [Segniliparus rotundus]ADG96856.1 NADH/Ubiquinone/plastoquinone (complex I) [Segniliparus rotundus DSM 44985]